VPSYEHLFAALRRQERDSRRLVGLQAKMALMPQLAVAATQVSCLQKAELLSASLKRIDAVASKGLVLLDRRLMPRIVDFFESAHYSTMGATGRMCVDVDEWYIHLREEECLAWDRMLLRFAQGRLRQKLESVGYLESMAESERLMRARLISQMLRSAPIRYTQNASTAYSSRQYLPQQPAVLTPAPEEPLAPRSQTALRSGAPAPPRGSGLSRRPRPASAATRPPSRGGGAYAPFRLGLSPALVKAIDGNRGTLRSASLQRPATAQMALSLAASPTAEDACDAANVDDEEDIVYI
jgi:hypothetical protein